MAAAIITIRLDEQSLAVVATATCGPGRAS